MGFTMSLNFQGSEKPTLGVEIELQIIDPETYDLIPYSEKILEICTQRNLRVKTEIHQSMIEVNSEISEDVKQCRDCLTSTILQLNDIVENLGLILGTTGTHPFQQWSERLISSSDRYQNLHEKFQWLARRMNVYGVHVHIGVSSGDRALALCHEMIKYLPHLLALSANSPFWQGIGTGMQASRINILDALPLSGFPEPFSNWKQFEDYYKTLMNVRAISSFKDIYWYVRPSPFYGTVEIRICDAMTKIDETMAITALIQCLVTQTNEELGEGLQLGLSKKHYWIVPENHWIAARDGLEGMIIVDLQGKRQKISDAILELIENLSPIAKRLNCLEELNYLSEIVKNGNGAQRQMINFSNTNSLQKVVEAAHTEFKLSLNATGK